MANLSPASRRLKPFWRAYKLWLRIDCVDLSAAFAYHSLQSLFPMVLIAMSLASKLLGRDEGLYERLIDLVSEVLPVTVMPAFSATLSAFLRQGFGAGVLGVVVLVLTASNAYLTLQRGADRLWWNRPFGFEGLSWQALVVRYLQLRLKALGLVSLFALLIVVDQAFTNMRLLGSSGLRQWTMALWPWADQFQQPVSWGLDLVIALVLATGASLLLLWVLPSRRIPWRPLIPGALLIGVSLTFLNLVLGRVLVTLGVRFQAYGLVGGVLVLSLWVWLVGVILYYGQCLCVVLDRRPRVRMGTP
ncbi:YhjD/YihY/BrkB family envelope integrity protein [Cyanobium sp. FACHB-13342]|uniref:YhjD/YihY/BrkB family envelope integrity protein n=1 Tax=Cyanobium sp. FACHB-13342 TaxID=2692793 RepID=UPI0016805D87|nr:YihY/virulence factor BrkB family protein [Cyanobium sp. FACHB-13342]